VFNATFNNILVISWQSVLLVEETGAPGENHLPCASHWLTLSHNVVSSTPRLSGILTQDVSCLYDFFICFSGQSIIFDASYWTIRTGRWRCNNRQSPTTSPQTSHLDSKGITWYV